MSELSFPDGESLADLATYVRRAARLDEDGAIRLQVAGSVLAAWVCVLPGSGLLRSGLVLGLRTMPVDPAGQEPGVDVTVPLAGVADRFARRAATGDASTRLSVPPTTVAPSWAALSAPRGGWEPVRTVSVAGLLEIAREGIAEVTRGAPEGSGSSAVASLRSRVWGREVDGVPAGAALAVHALGFVGADDPAAAPPATVHRSGAWLRVSTSAGHVILRP